MLFHQKLEWKIVLFPIQNALVKYLVLNQKVNRPETFTWQPNWLGTKLEHLPIRNCRFEMYYGFWMQILGKIQKGLIKYWTVLTKKVNRPGSFTWPEGLQRHGFEWKTCPWCQLNSHPYPPVGFCFGLTDPNINSILNQPKKTLILTFKNL